MHLGSYFMETDRPKLSLSGLEPVVHLSNLNYSLFYSCVALYSASMKSFTQYSYKQSETVYKSSSLGRALDRMKIIDNMIQIESLIFFFFDFFFKDFSIYKKLIFVFK